MSIIVTHSIRSFALTAVKFVVLLMLERMTDLNERQVKDFWRGFHDAAIGHDTYNKRSEDDEHYVKAFGIGKEWREGLPRTGQRTR